jgi:hypothetical protein
MMGQRSSKAVEGEGMGVEDTAADAAGCAIGGMAGGMCIL